MKNVSQGAASGDGPGDNSVMRGIVWTLISGLFFIVVTGVVRHLGSDMHPVQAAFIRYALGTAILLPTFWKMRHHLPRRGRLALHSIRGLVHGIGVMLWFYAMMRIPIADVTALGFTSPIFITIGAALFLGERFRWRRTLAVLAGFAGTMVILRPGLTVIDDGAIAMLLAAPLFAVSMLIAKKLTDSENPAAIVAFMSVTVTLVLLGPALLVWRPPTPSEWLWLLVTAICATSGHVALTKAFQATDITISQAVSFLQLVWATLLGFYVFAEVPDGWTIFGGAIVIASACYMAHREARARRGPKHAD